MSEEKRNNGNEVAEIIANGSLLFSDDYTEILGDIKATKELIFKGDVKVAGDVTANSIFVDGNAEIAGEVVATVIEVGGELVIGKSANIDDVCAESIYVAGCLRSTVEIETGTLMVGGDLDAFVVSLSHEEGETNQNEDLIVEGNQTIEEALYINDEEVCP